MQTSSYVRERGGDVMTLRLRVNFRAKCQIDNKAIGLSISLFIFKCHVCDIGRYSLDISTPYRLFYSFIVREK